MNASNASPSPGSDSPSTDSPGTDSPGTDSAVVDFFWRPGCPFCMNLERKLTKSGVPLSKHNIWEDNEAADFVRSVADGNETVPTVRVGAISMVNPSAKQVTRAIDSEYPELASTLGPGESEAKATGLLQRLIGG